MNCSCKLLVKNLSAIYHQRITINTHIAKVQAPNVVFWLLDDIELAIEKAIQKSTNANLLSKLFQDDSNYEKNQFVEFVSSHKNGTLLTPFHIHSLVVLHTDL
jgi:hypothetical protein